MIGCFLQLLSENRFLYVDKSSTADAGVYICRVENAAGVVVKKFDVRVIEKPSLLKAEPELKAVGVLTSF